MTHGVFINFLRALHKDPTRLVVAQDGKQAKPYIYVSDLVEAIMLGWSKSKKAINLFNIGNSPLVSVNEIVQCLFEALGLQDVKTEYTGSPAWPGDVRTYDFDDAKIREFGYAPRFTAKEAARQTAHDLIANKTLYL